MASATYLDAFAERKFVCNLSVNKSASYRVICGGCYHAIYAYISLEDNQELVENSYQMHNIPERHFFRKVKEKLNIKISPQQISHMHIIYVCYSCREEINLNIFVNRES